MIPSREEFRMTKTPEMKFLIPSSSFSGGASSRRRLIS